VGKDYRFLKVNRSLCEMVEPSESELLAISFADLTYWDFRQSDIELAEALFQGEIAFYQMSKRYVKKSGEIVWANMTRSVIRDCEDAPLYALTMIEDITERRRADEALRTSEERFRVALKGSPVAVFNQDHQLRYTWVSAPVLAWAEQDYLGHTDTEIGGGEEAHV
jgi:PAS domain S-box-containing protein